MSVGNIPLEPGTRVVTVKQIPYLLSCALHSEDTPIRLAASQMRHEELLLSAISSGEIVPLNVLTMEPQPHTKKLSSLGSAVVPVEVFRRYAAQFHLFVYVKDGNAEEALANRYKAQEQDFRRMGRYTVEDAAKELSKTTGWAEAQWLKRIREAVNSREVDLRNPQEPENPLPFDLPKVPRDFYDQVSANGPKSINAWLEKHPEWGVRLGADDASKAKSVDVRRPLPMQRQQEQAILAALQGLGYNPAQLPKPKSGKPGVKAEVRALLNYTPTVFDRAWERLRKSKEIGDMP